MPACKKHLMDIRMNLRKIQSKATHFILPVAVLSLVSLSFNVSGAVPKGTAKLTISGESPISMESGSGDQFAMTQTSITLPLENNTQRTESFRSSFHANMTEFDWRGVDAASSDYVWLSMPMYYQQKRSNNTRFIIQAEPGLMTDGENIGIDSVGINGSVIGRILWSNGGYWQYGLMVDRAFGDYDVRPVLGMAFQADNKTWVELGFPKINVTHNFSSDLISYLTIKPVGGVWKETIDIEAADAAAGDDAEAAADDTADTTGTSATGSKDMHIRYRSWQLGVGANFYWRESLWLSAEVGQLRNRRISAGDSTGAKIKGTPSENTYWRVGASLKF